MKRNSAIERQMLQARVNNEAIYVVMCELIRKKRIDFFGNMSNYRKLKEDNYRIWLKTMCELCDSDEFKTIIDLYYEIIHNNYLYLKELGYVTFEHYIKQLMLFECGFRINKLIDLWLVEHINNLELSRKVVMKDMDILDFGKNDILKTNMEKRLKITKGNCPKIKIDDEICTIEVTNKKDYSSLAHEYGHYCFEQFIYEGDNRTYTIVESEIVALIYEICYYYRAGNTKKNIIIYYKWMLGWFCALSDYEPYLYRYKERNINSFEHFLSNYFDNIEENIYYKYMWIAQGHIAKNPGYCYIYKLALASVLRYFIVSKNVNCFINNIVKMLNDYKNNKEASLLKLLWSF